MIKSYNLHSVIAEKFKHRYSTFTVYQPITVPQLYYWLHHNCL